jgi:ribosomal-protein-alanine N-acetyltransferase
LNILQTHRLILRQLTIEDAPDLFRIYSDPLTMRFMGPPPASVEAEAANIERHIRNSYQRWGYGLWAVELSQTGSLIGWCGLLRCELDGKPETEISFLIDRQQWGDGYATEAAAAVVQHASGTLRIDRLLAFIMPANIASARVVQRVGFRPAGQTDYKKFGRVDLYVKEPEEPIAYSLPIGTNR